MKIHAVIAQRIVNEIDNELKNISCNACIEKTAYCYECQKAADFIEDALNALESSLKHFKD